MYKRVSSDQQTSIILGIYHNQCFFLGLGGRGATAAETPNLELINSILSDKKKISVKTTSLREQTSDFIQ